MQTIGERLEEARKRKGISLREAAEATKIRSDFLASIEQDKFDFDLPDIYKRGFLKNYARYLKLDVEKALTDYNAQQLSNTRLGKKAGAEWFGQMEVRKPQKREAPEPEEENPHSLGRISPGSSAKSGTALQAAEESEEDPDLDSENDKTFYLKIGLIFVGTLALVFVIFGLIWAILGGGGDQGSVEEPEFSQNSGSGEALSEGSSNGGSTAGGSGSDSSASSDSLTLRASGTVYVLVRQKEDDTELYRETMSAGESKTLEKSGPVDILFTAGENLTIEHGGERLKPSSAGTAKITIP